MIVQTQGSTPAMINAFIFIPAGTLVWLGTIASLQIFNVIMDIEENTRKMAKP